MNVNPTLVTIDNTKAFNEIINSFKKDSVLVGIPAEDDNREKEKGEIGNAALLAINVFGSPANNIPPRDVMSTGIYNAKPAIAEQFKLCAQNVFNQGKKALETYYERAGIIASNSIKKAINDQDSIEPPAASTLKARKARGFKGTKALIVTGQMRNAITYVVNTVWGRG